MGVNLQDLGGGCLRMTSGENSRNLTAELAKTPKIAVERRTGRFYSEETRISMHCSVVVDPEMANMRGCKLMVFTGQLRVIVRMAHGSTTLLRARKDSIVRAVGRRKGPFRFGASATD